jgi:Tfp pilus assembly ATPase PilU
MNVKNAVHGDLLLMCTDSEKQIAKLELLYEYRIPQDLIARQELKSLIEVMKDMQGSLEQLYENAIGKRFESKMVEYRTTLMKRLVN